MMAHSYECWHSFYESKKGYKQFMEEGRYMIQYNKKADVATGFPNATKNTTPAKDVFQK